MEASSQVALENLPKMKKIVVTGSSGLLGSIITQLVKNDFIVVPIHFRERLFSDSIKLDITNKSEVFGLLQKLKPDILIHVAAETNVDRCEREKNYAWKTNVEGTRNLAEICGKNNAKMVFISTDYVFDGEKGLYKEKDEPNPINYYGLTKLKGEEELEKNCWDYVIARTSVLYDWSRRKLNFATWVIDSLRRNQNIQVVDDHFNSPTLASNLSEALLEIVKKDLSGIYHMAGSERLNRYAFSLRIAEKFNLDAGLIKPIKMSELATWVAKRPKDSSLSLEKAIKKLQTKFLNVQESLNIMKDKEVVKGERF